MTHPAQRSFTLDDYWAVEMSSPLRHEYVNGSIYAMAGGSPRDNEVAANILYALRRALDDTSCRPVGSDQRIRVSNREYTYADVTVYCGRIEIAPGPPPDTAVNPVVIVEVLSDSTRAYDHGDKRQMYQSMPSVQEIWLVEPDASAITVWRRHPTGWEHKAYREADTQMPVLGRSVSWSDIYAQTLAE